MAVILVGGGARSGKSRKALDLAREHGPHAVFLATAQAFDDEMRRRIEQHRASRGSGFEVIEEPLELAERVRESTGTVVIDCLTLWVSNLVLAGRDVETETTHLVAAASEHSGTLVFVTNEVGCGIVPDNELARRFRDEAGRVNRRIAEIACEVYWMVFGCALRVK